jgi:hypothetical protein
MEAKKKYWNDRQVSAVTGLAVQTLRNQRSKGKGIPYSKVGRRVLYDSAEVIGFIESRKRST